MMKNYILMGGKLQFWNKKNKPRILKQSTLTHILQQVVDLYLLGTPFKSQPYETIFGGLSY